MASRYGVYGVDLAIEDVQAQRNYQRQRKHTYCILSRHYARPVLYSTLSRERMQAEDLGADIVKLVYPVEYHREGLPLLRLLRERVPWRKPLLGLAMGLAGQWTRILANTFPHASPYNFAKLSEEDIGSARGQLDWHKMHYVYRVPFLRDKTTILGLWGYPIQHSKSYVFHNILLQNSGAYDYVYVPFSEPENGEGFLQHFAPKLGIKGLSVTAPYKALAYRVSRGDLWSAQCDLANTLIYEERLGWLSSLTDYSAAYGCIEDLKSRVLAGVVWPSITILGTGATAWICLKAAHALGFRLCVMGRNRDKVLALAKRFRAEGKCMDEKVTTDILINATTIGRGGAGERIDIRGRIACRAIFDVNYGKDLTLLATDARDLGIPYISGEKMFYHQAMQQWRLFTGIKPMGCKGAYQ